jgi:hypothetical protein
MAPRTLTPDTGAFVRLGASVVGIIAAFVATGIGANLPDESDQWASLSRGLDFAGFSLFAVVASVAVLNSVWWTLRGPSLRAKKSGMQYTSDMVATVLGLIAISTITVFILLFLLVIESGALTGAR